MLRDWNKLPHSVVLAPCLETFKSRLWVCLRDRRLPNVVQLLIVTSIDIVSFDASTFISCLHLRFLFLIDLFADIQRPFSFLLLQIATLWDAKYLPPEHPIMSFETIEIKNGRHICKKIYNACSQESSYEKEVGCMVTEEKKV